ncbi:MAG: SPASM domain-containing protein [Syntrophotaleaceae bacterium]
MEDKVDLVNIITYQTYTGSVEDRRPGRPEPRSRQRHACKQLLRGDLIIHWNGDVYGCCRNMSDDLLLGNLESTGIADLFNGARRGELVERHLALEWDQVESCRNCLQEWSF